MTGVLVRQRRTERDGRNGRNDGRDDRDVRDGRDDRDDRDVRDGRINRARRADLVSTDTTLGQVLRGARWAAMVAFVVVLGYAWHRDGVPFDRDGLLFWIAIGLGTCCIGRHPKWLLWVAVDFLPFALVLFAYDYLRGLADTFGMPTWWQPQLQLDRVLFFGHQPALWLQEHLKHARADVQWYDVVVCACYYSFFFLPYVVAGVMWLRSRVDFYRWSLRFVALSFVSFALFVLIPAAPPWAAALCTPADVANHPHNPPCMALPAHPVAGNLLGTFTAHNAGANPYLERLPGQAFYKLHLGVAHTLWTKGVNVADAVAAVPSLHVGGTVLFCIFMWRRLRRSWRPVLIAYPLLMMFSLVYTGEHYVADGIAGALVAWGVHRAAGRVERWRERPRRPDTLGDRESPPAAVLESACPPPDPLTVTTPSSI